MRLKGKTAFVTGGNRGIGLEVCRQLGVEGANVLIGARDRQKATTALADLQKSGVEASFILLDLSDPESIYAAIAQLSNSVDILINNAAQLDKRENLLSIDDGKLEEIFRVNFIGPVLLTKHLVAAMSDRKWGRVVNVSSGMGAISRGFSSDSAAYRLSKLALNGFTLSLADTLKGTGVLVNAVDPGWVRTEMGGPSAWKSPQEGARSIVWAVLLPDRGPTGGFFRDGKRIDW